jgi:hypothetical protein
VSQFKSTALESLIALFARVMQDVIMREIGQNYEEPVRSFVSTGRHWRTTGLTINSILGDLLSVMGNPKQTTQMNPM